MIDGKPTLTFGDGQASSRIQNGRGNFSARKMQAGGTPFSSFLPTAEKRAGHGTSSTLISANPRAGQSDDGRKSPFPALSANQARNADRSRQTDYAANIPAARRQVPPMGKQSFAAARENAQRYTENMAGDMPGTVRRQSVVQRVPGNRPITGRSGIGMEDTRKNPTSFQKARLSFQRT